MFENSQEYSPQKKKKIAKLQTLRLKLPFELHFMTEKIIL